MRCSDLFITFCKFTHALQATVVRSLSADSTAQLLRFELRRVICKKSFRLNWICIHQNWVTFIDSNILSWFKSVGYFRVLLKVSFTQFDSLSGFKLNLGPIILKKILMNRILNLKFLLFGIIFCLNFNTFNCLKRWWLNWLFCLEFSIKIIRCYCLRQLSSIYIDCIILFWSFKSLLHIYFFIFYFDNSLRQLCIFRWFDLPIL